MAYGNVAYGSVTYGGEIVSVSVSVEKPNLGLSRKREKELIIEIYCPIEKYNYEEFKIYSPIKKIKNIIFGIIAPIKKIKNRLINLKITLDSSKLKNILNAIWF